MTTQTLQQTTLSATTLIGEPVRNLKGEDLGKVEDIMIDLNNGRVAYVVLSFGGFLGIGNKLFAVPWAAMAVDTQRKSFILDVPKERLKNAPGFDKDNWPDASDLEWRGQVYSYYSIAPDWL